MTRQGGPGSDFAADGFFDFNYRIQFDGRQESEYLEGWRGITLGPESTYRLCPAQAGGAPTQDGPVSLSAAPNPMRSGTQVLIRSEIEEPGRIVVFDASGRRIRTLFDGMIRPGTQPVEWNGRDDGGNDAPSGAYFVKVFRASGSSSLRLSLVRG